ncbi:hypothetical protein ACIQNU_25055 [Streptomyces sp. NPDC091292]|uniref:hypothetical protein n=1 Tax=Streptomyces sp. NPDC091292 TaxID=3365991 RepID=UPI00381FF916
MSGNPGGNDRNRFRLQGEYDPSRGFAGPSRDYGSGAGQVPQSAVQANNPAPVTDQYGYAVDELPAYARDGVGYSDQRATSAYSYTSAPSRGASEPGNAPGYGAATDAPRHGSAPAGGNYGTSAGGNITGNPYTTSPTRMTPSPPRTANQSVSQYANTGQSASSSERRRTDPGSSSGHRSSRQGHGHGQNRQSGQGRNSR